MQIQGLLMLLLMAIPDMPTGKLSQFYRAILQVSYFNTAPSFGGPGLPLAAVCGHRL